MSIPTVNYSRWEAAAPSAALAAAPLPPPGGKGLLYLKLNKYPTTGKQSFLGRILTRGLEAKTYCTAPTIGEGLNWNDLPSSDHLVGMESEWSWPFRSLQLSKSGLNIALTGVSVAVGDRSLSSSQIRANMVDTDWEPLFGDTLKT
ncbi:hypothetical protein C8F04DRAFT_1190327 [Mycena alexandri]|uniref:Uncharacterized protein n=1 Tax=Mycena alexandri TaxID=1745969 RepID=A0AAD6WX70_9AGAR|nr:hypothetical protein C8F04DRAFT_1190327 [Mycena alexandri]